MRAAGRTGTVVTRVSVLGGLAILKGRGLRPRGCSLSLCAGRQRGSSWRRRLWLLALGASCSRTPWWGFSLAGFRAAAGPCGGHQAANTGGGRRVSSDGCFDCGEGHVARDCPVAKPAGMAHTWRKARARALQWLQRNFILAGAYIYESAASTSWSHWLSSCCAYGSRGRKAARPRLVQSLRQVREAGRQQGTAVRALHVSSKTPVHLCPAPTGIFSSRKMIARIQPQKSEAALR